MKTIKIYLVEFLNYTNCMKDTVSDWDGNPDHISDINYLSVKSPFLIKESDISYFQKFGGGFNLLKYVGDLGVLEASDVDPSIDSIKVVDFEPAQFVDYPSPQDDSFTPTGRPEPVPDVIVTCQNESFDYSEISSIAEDFKSSNASTSGLA